MTSYKGKPLFSSGPHGFRDHGLDLRHELIETSGVDGARVVAEGKTARRITQAGAIYGDTPPQLRQRIDAVEQSMDGLGGELIDSLDRALPRMVLTEMKLSRIRPAGPRYRVDYSLLYVQTLPDPAPPETPPTPTPPGEIPPVPPLIPPEVPPTEPPIDPPIDPPTIPPVVPPTLPPDLPPGVPPPLPPVVEPPPIPPPIPPSPVPIQPPDPPAPTLPGGGGPL